MSDEKHGANVADRRQLSMSQLAVIVALVLNLGGLIWGAGRLSETVKNQGLLTTQNAQLLDRIADKVNDHEARLRVVEDRGDIQRRP